MTNSTITALEAEEAYVSSEIEKLKAARLPVTRSTDRRRQTQDPVAIWDAKFRSLYCTFGTSRLTIGRCDTLRCAREAIAIMQPSPLKSPTRIRLYKDAAPPGIRGWLLLHWHIDLADIKKAITIDLSAFGKLLATIHIPLHTDA